MGSIVSGLKKTSRNPVVYSFEQIPTVMEVPYLLETQKKSYEEFLQKDIPSNARENVGLQEAFTSVFPVTTPSTPSSLEFVEYSFGVSKNAPSGA